MLWLRRHLRKLDHRGDHYELGSVTATSISLSQITGSGIVGAASIDGSSIVTSGGVGAAADEDLSITGSTIAGNSGGVSGVGMLEDSVIPNNGGGVSTSVSATITGSRILRNGGAGVTGAPAISASTIAGNSGSGIVLTGAGSVSGSIVDNGDGNSGRYAVEHTGTGDAACEQSYWGAAATAQMDAADANGNRQNDEQANLSAIYDGHDKVLTDAGKVGYDNWLAAPPANAPTYLQDLTLDPPSPVSAQRVDFIMRFSNTMDMGVTPVVTFGLGGSFTDMALANPTWSTSAVPNDTLTMSYLVVSETPDGTHTLRVSGARDSAGRTLPDDTATTFVIDTPVGIARGVALGWQVLGVPASPAARDSGEAILSWQTVPENDLGGYTVLWGLSPGQLTSAQDAGLATSATIAGLTPGLTYYFAVQTREDNGSPGPISEIVSGVVPESPMATATPTVAATPSPTATLGAVTPTHTPSVTPTSTPPGNKVPSGRHGLLILLLAIPALVSFQRRKVAPGPPAAGPGMPAGNRYSTCWRADR
ncbi:MAG: fibronectin type III domain-containing protein [Candidatus Schekmanbacteria bacterium]|nr:fibronectin type III domain-containing protein [Candidatus Schekmanbacteria bacterium]